MKKINKNMSIDKPKELSIDKSDDISEVFHFRLISGEQIVGQIIGEDPHDSNNLIIKYPMAIENVMGNGVGAMNLSKFLPFDPNQILLLRKEHIITISLTSNLFSKYYYNAIEFQELVIEPQNNFNLQKVNEHLEFVLSQSNQKFIENLKKYKDRIPEIPQGIQ